MVENIVNSIQNNLNLNLSPSGIIKAIIIFLFGYYIKKMYDGVHSYFLKYFKSKGVRNKLNKRLAANSASTLGNLNILTLGNANPYDSKKGINILLSNKSLYVGFPEDLREELQRSFHKDDIAEEFVMNTDSSFDGGSSFSDIARTTDIFNLPDLINKHRKIVARHFIEKSNGCHFNKTKLGVFKINTHSRHGENENPVINMELFQTDYFTHKVFRSIYKELCSSGHSISQVNDDMELQKYNAFTTSFGINCLIILKYEHGVKDFILTKRSTNATEVNSRNQYNISMLEGLTDTDRDNTDKIDLRKCVERGLCEELGIEDIHSYDSTIKFYDVFLERNFLELGITCAVEISNMSVEELQHKAEYAKDRTLEISELVKITNDKKVLSEFLRKNEFKQQALFTIQRICTREGIKIE
ncbi:hypothetical protein FHS15_005461 [Paenibacillus castaneae]|uniref:hypothetical protein n=1 Tax=Paenibacillus castaneae TaxID=474957 RepID=UPI000C9BEC3A|nr:hypothetical protein [Paenibacillus castaneae]NIK80277.1 hypothetical protein [Paenibacillus castaneae]